MLPEGQFSHWVYLPERYERCCSPLRFVPGRLSVPPRWALPMRRSPEWCTVGCHLIVDADWESAAHFGVHQMNKTHFDVENWGFHECGIPNSWLVFIMEHPLFRKSFEWLI